MSDPVFSGTPGVTEETVTFEAVRDDGTAHPTLIGTLVRPESTIPVSRGVVTVHGWGGTRTGPHRMMVRITRALAAKGVPALRFDLAGRGESDGVAAESNLDGMIADTVAAIRFLQKTTGCQDVALTGICSGGNVAIGTATLISCSRLALISTLPFNPASSHAAARKTASRLSEFARKAMSVETWARALRGEINWGGVGKTLSSSMHEDQEERKLKDSSRDIMAAFASLHTPSLFVYGGNDPEARSAREHYARFCEEHTIPATFRTIAGANHNFYSVTWSTEVKDAVIGFLCD